MSISYGYFCEDAAIELFIDSVLEKLGPSTKCREFIKHQECFDAYKSTGSTNVNTIKREYLNVGKKAITDFAIDMYLVGYDYDDADIAAYDNHITDQSDKLDIKIRRKSILCIPISCIEYWLHYIKFGGSRNELENRENFTRHHAKAEVYERPLENDKYNKLSEARELEKAKEILTRLDIPTLRTLSSSFDHFINQIIEFCRTYA